MSTYDTTAAAGQLKITTRGGRVAKKHIGFEKAAEKAAQSYGGNIERGRGAIAAAARRASPAAKRANPRLNRVKVAKSQLRKKTY